MANFPVLIWVFLISVFFFQNTNDFINEPKETSKVLETRISVAIKSVYCLG